MSGNLMNVPSCLRTVSIALTYLLSTQCVTAPLAGAQQAQPKLNIVILEGEGAINNVRQRLAREPIVQVQDENNRPVSGALVTFLLPESGPGGTFPGGARSLTVTTDAQGRAVAKGLRTNDAPGKFQIQVTATYAGATATATITQSNILGAAAAGISGKLLAILAIAGGAVAAGVVAATRGGNGGPAPSPPIVISPGPPSVGPPR